MDYEKLEKSAKAKGIVRNVVIYTLLILWAVMVLFPFYWMILTSVKSYGSYNSEYVPSFFRITSMHLPRFLWADIYGTP